MLFSKAPACGWLVVGLGNPGLNYARTRHNVGFRAVDALAEKLGVKIDRARFRGLTAQASAGGEKLLLLKPQTFMNDSGLSGWRQGPSGRTRRSVSATVPEKITLSCGT